MAEHRAPKMALICLLALALVGCSSAQPVNTCIYPGTVCGANATCLKTPDDAQARCYCNYGYEGDGGTCVLGCQKQGLTCSRNAQCARNGRNGAYTCQCNTDYSGDGITCAKRETQYCIIPGWTAPDASVLYQPLPTSFRVLLLLNYNAQTPLVLVPLNTEVKPTCNLGYFFVPDVHHLFCRSVNGALKTVWEPSSTSTLCAAPKTKSCTPTSCPVANTCLETKTGFYCATWTCSNGLRLQVHNAYLGVGNWQDYSNAKAVCSRIDPQHNSSLPAAINADCAELFMTHIENQNVFDGWQHVAVFTDQVVENSGLTSQRHETSLFTKRPVMCQVDPNACKKMYASGATIPNGCLTCSGDTPVYVRNKKLGIEVPFAECTGESPGFAFFPIALAERSDELMPYGSLERASRMCGQFGGIIKNRTCAATLFNLAWRKKGLGLFGRLAWLGDKPSTVDSTSPVVDLQDLSNTELALYPSQIANIICFTNNKCSIIGCRKCSALGLEGVVSTAGKVVYDRNQTLDYVVCKPDYKLSATPITCQDGGGAASKWNFPSPCLRQSCARPVTSLEISPPQESYAIDTWVKLECKTRAGVAALYCMSSLKFGGAYWSGPTSC